MESVILKIVLGKNHKYIYNNIMDFKCLMILYSLILIFILMLFMMYIIKQKKRTVEKFIENIPKIVHQTYSSYEDIPECVKTIMKKNEKRNPNYEFRFYDDEKIDRYVKENVDDRAYSAFKKLSPTCGACRADFFRYVVVYQEGGIYADIKTLFEKPLDEWINDNAKIKLTMWPWMKWKKLKKFYHTDHIPNSENYEINQAVILYPPKHDILKEVIVNMVDKIHKKNKNKKKKSNPMDVLETTGPHLYTNVIAKNLDNLDYEFMIDGDNLYNGNVIYDGTKGCYHETQRNQNKRYKGLFLND